MSKTSALREDRARIRYGEWDVPASQAFTELRHDPKLVKDCALLSVASYQDLSTSQASSINLSKCSRKWERIAISDFPEPPSKYWVVGGLSFDTWISRNDDGRPIAVLVFRGTKLTKFGDFFSNFRWITKFFPWTWDQYDQVRHRIGHAIKVLHDKFDDTILIVAAGHSLGGGLAQHACYSSNRIKVVYAFNPSPVTGFYSIHKTQREQNAREVRILRIYEHGEVLAYLRSILRTFYPLSHRDPQITEVRFNFGRGDAVSKHGMSKFAKGLLSLFPAQSQTCEGFPSGSQPDLRVSNATRPLGGSETPTPKIERTSAVDEATHSLDRIRPASPADRSHDNSVLG